MSFLGDRTGGWLVGDKPRVRATCADVDGMLVDPASLTVLVRDPEGFETSYTYGVDAEITRASLGVFDVFVDLTKPGDWFVRWKGAGSLQGAEEVRIRARSSAFTSP